MIKQLTRNSILRPKTNEVVRAYLSNVEYCSQEAAVVTDR